MMLGLNRDRLPFLVYALTALLPVFGGGNFPGLLGPQGNALIWQVLSLLTFGLFVLSRQEVPLPLTKQGLVWPFYALLALALLALPFARPLNGAWRQTFQLLGYASLAFTLLLWRPDAATRRRLLSLLLAGVGVAALYALYQVFIRFPALAEDPTLSAADARLAHETVRPFSFYPGANVFAGVLITAVPLAIYLWQGAKARWERFVWPAFLALDAYVLVLTYSRGAWLALALGAFGIAAVFVKRGWRVACLAGLAVAIVVSGLVLTHQVNLDDAVHTVVSTVSPAEQGARLDTRTSMDARTLYWQTAWRMGRDLFPFGGGLGSFADRSRQYQSTTTYARFPHNILLSFYTSWGVAGVLIWLALLGAGVWAVWRTRDTDVARESALIGLALLILSLHASLDVDLDMPGVLGLFLALWALLILPDLRGRYVAAVGQRVASGPGRILLTAVAIPAITLAQFMPLLADNYGDLADFAEKASTPEKAMDMAQQALHYWPYDARAHYRLSHLWQESSRISGKRDELGKARESVERALELNPFDPELALGYADVLSALSDFERTGRLLAHASELYPASLHYLTQYAKVLAFEKQPEQALRLLNKGIAEQEPLYLAYRNPDGLDVVDAHFLQAALYNDLKDFASARRAYRGIIALLDKPELVFGSYVSSRADNPDRASIRHVAEEYIKRIDEGRTRPEKEADVKEGDLPKNINLRNLMEKHGMQVPGGQGGPALPMGPRVTPGQP